jgi:hypothetical protein
MSIYIIYHTWKAELLVNYPALLPHAVHSVVEDGASTLRTGDF